MHSPYSSYSPYSSQSSQSSYSPYSHNSLKRAQSPTAEIKGINKGNKGINKTQANKNTDKIDDSGILEFSRRINSKYVCCYSDNTPNLFIFVLKSKTSFYKLTQENKLEFKRILVDYYNPLRIYVKGPHEIENTPNWSIKLEHMPQRPWATN